MFLTARKKDASFTDVSIKTVLKSGNEVCKKGIPDSIVNIAFRGLWIAQQDIIPNAPFKQEVILEHIGDVLAQFLDMKVSDVCSVDFDASGIDIIKTGKKAGKRTFPTAGIADQRKHLTWPDGHRDVAKHIGAFNIAEMNMIILYRL